MKVARSIVPFALCALVSLHAFGIDLQPDGYHVYPGGNIQEAVQAAAGNRTNKVVKVHAGEYRPQSKRQAMIWLNAMHDGIRLEAVGDVTLTGANPQITSPAAPGYPAVVNHVVYFGHGITSNTVLKGFRITGANHFISEKMTKQLEPDTTVPKNLFFYTDGGAVKIFGRSAPTLQNLELVDNFASPCGAGISIQQEGWNQSPVLIENCVLLRNRAQVTGAAIDLLEGSAARILNCLFVGNASNLGEDVVARRSGEPPITNCGVLTIFQHSRAEVRHCTFTANRNAVDDLGGRSVYVDCIFADNTLATGTAGSERFELDLPAGAQVSGCVIRGRLRDPKQAVSARANQLTGPPPGFDARFVPGAAAYQRAGYRPVETPRR